MAGRRREALRGAEVETLDLIFQVLKYDEVAGLLKGPLERAAGQGNRDLAQKLVEAGAEIGYALHEAVKGGHGEVVNDLLDTGASINSEHTVFGWTPLHVAAKAGRTEMVQLLMKRGADKDARDNAVWTPLISAANFGHVAAALALLVGGADVSVRCGYSQSSVVAVAAEKGHVDILRAVIKHGADVNAADISQGTALHAAAGENRAKAIDVLFEAGGNIEAQDIVGETPVHHACWNLGLAALDVLLKHGAHVNANTPELGTPLHYAAHNAGRQGAAEVVDLLLRSGADETIVDAEGQVAAEVVADAVVEEDPIEGEIERVYELLANAPADRAWRRRGYLVLCRAHPDRAHQTREASGACAGTLRRGSGGAKRRRPAASHCNEGVRQTAVDEGSGVDWAHVLARVLELQEEGIFRTIVGYL